MTSMNPFVVDDNEYVPGIVDVINKICFWCNFEKLISFFFLKKKQFDEIETQQFILRDIEFKLLQRTTQQAADMTALMNAPPLAESGPQRKRAWAQMHEPEEEEEEEDLDDDDDEYVPQRRMALWPRPEARPSTSSPEDSARPSSEPLLARSKRLPAFSVRWNDSPDGLMWEPSTSARPSASASSASPQVASACCVCSPGGPYVGPFVVTCGNGHPICGDCFDPFFETVIQKPVQSYLSGIPCVDHRCPANIPFKDLPPVTVIRMTEHFASALTPKPNASALTQVVETVCLFCPGCRRPVERNPAGCNNFTCTGCETGFCGCCLKKGCDPARHVTNKHARECGSSKTFCKHAREKGQNKIIKRQVLAFFQALPLIDRQPCLDVLVPHLPKRTAKTFTKLINLM